MKNNPNCTRCRLSSKGCIHVCMLGDGPVPCDVMVIGEAPGAQEDREGVPFVGRAGRLLDEALEAAEMDRDAVFVCNAVSCRPPENKTPTEAQIRECRYWLQYQIDQVKPKFILTLGNTALKGITHNGGITKVRGIPQYLDMPHGQVLMLPTIHPAAVLYDDNKRETFFGDIQKLQYYVEHGGIPKNDVEYKIIEDLDDIETLNKIISIDLETSGLDPFADDAAIHHMVLYSAGVSYIIDADHIDRDKLQYIANECWVIFHNAKFDTLWMLEHLDVTFDKVECTMLMDYILYNTRSHSLKDCAVRELNAYDWDEDPQVKLSRELTDRKCYYMACDGKFTYMLFFRIGERLKYHGMEQLYRFTMRCSTMYTDIEFTGINIDQDKIEDEAANKEEIIRECNKELKKWGRVSWDSPKQLSTFLYTDLGLEPPFLTKGMTGSTSELALKLIRDPVGSKIAKVLIKRKKAYSALNKFLDAWPNHIKHTGRVHPTYKIHGTVTGRPSCQNPNLQQTPREKALRNCFIPSPRYEMIEADLSQIELRIAAHMSKDDNMMRIYHDDGDIHWHTACEILKLGYTDDDIELIQATADALGIEDSSVEDILNDLQQYDYNELEDLEPKWKKKRTDAKPVNFGFLYGMWYTTFIHQTLKDYDILFTEDQAKLAREAFFDAYSGLLDYYKRVEKFVRRNGYIETLTGRRHYLPEAQNGDGRDPQVREAVRKAINQPIQGLAAEINLMCAVEVHETLKDARIVGTIHDNMLIECKPKVLKYVEEQVLDIMSDPKYLRAFDIKLDVPLKGEVKIGPWGS